jgi:hypothetical protein
MANIWNEVCIEGEQDGLRVLIVKGCNDSFDHSHRLHRWAEKLEEREAGERDGAKHGCLDVTGQNQR